MRGGKMKNGGIRCLNGWVVTCHPMNTSKCVGLVKTGEGGVIYHDQNGLVMVGLSMLTDLNQ